MLAKLLFVRPKGTNKLRTASPSKTARANAVFSIHFATLSVRRPEWALKPVRWSEYSRKKLNAASSYHRWSRLHRLAHLRRPSFSQFLRQAAPQIHAPRSRIAAARHA